MSKSLLLILVLIAIVAISMALLLYFFLEPFPLQNTLTPIFLSVLVVAIFGTLLSLPGRIGMIATLLAVIALFISILLVKWWQAQSDGSLIGGLLPWSDASNYYHGAKNLVEGNDLPLWNGRRPLSTGMLAIFLVLAGQNLQLTLGLLVLITAVSVFFLTLEVSNRYGVMAGAVTLLVITLFYYRFVGTVLSEHLGLALGALALTLLLNGAFKGRMVTIWAGLFFLGVALVARAGAFLVLPVLLMGGTFLLWDKKRDRLAFMLGGSVSITLSFLVDSILRKIVAPEALPFGNFSYTLYGVVVGNQGYRQVISDHPEIANLSAGIERPRVIYQLALEALRSDPSLAVKGLLLTWLDFIKEGLGAFSFVIRVPHFSYFPTIILFVLCAVGIYMVVRYRHKPPNTILLLLVAGILLSIPFVPPRDASAMRAYAATIPAQAVVVGLGASALMRQIRLKRFKFAFEKPSDNIPVIVPVAVGFLMVGISFLGPILLSQRSGQSSELVQYDPAYCSQDAKLHHIRFLPGSSLNLIEGERRSTPLDQNVSLDSFREGLQGLRAYPELVDELSGLQTGQTLTLAINLNRIAEDIDGGLRWLVIDSERLNHLPPGIMRICARPTTNAWVSRYNFYYVDSIEAVKP